MCVFERRPHRKRFRRGLLLCVEGLEAMRLAETPPYGAPGFPCLRGVTRSLSLQFPLVLQSSCRSRALIDGISGFSDSFLRLCRDFPLLRTPRLFSARPQIAASWGNASFLFLCCLRCFSSCGIAAKKLSSGRIFLVGIRCTVFLRSRKKAPSVFANVSPRFPAVRHRLSAV